MQLLRLTIKLVCPPLLSEKLVEQNGESWCLDIFDKFVVAGQSVHLGEAVVRRYRPVSADHDHIVLGVFCSEDDDPQVRKALVHHPTFVLPLDLLEFM